MASSNKPAPIEKAASSEGSLSDRMMKARCRLLTMEPFYGTMASMFRWIKTPDKKQIKTMGVCIVDAEVHCYYNEEWCDTLTVDQLTGVIKHEVEHIVKLHPVRIGSREHKTWNVSCDMIINGRKTNPRIEYIKQIDDMFQKEGRSIIWMPDDVKEDITSEEMFDHIVKNGEKYPRCNRCGGRHPQPQPKGKGNQQGQNQGNQQGQNQGSQPGQQPGNQPGQGGQGSSQGQNGNQPGSGQGDDDDDDYGCTLDDHGMWGRTNASEDEAKQMVRDMVKNAIQAGNAPNHLMEDIRKLDKPKVSWKGELNQWIGRHVGNRRRTYSRIPRKKDDAFGLKGWSSHAQVPLTVLVDTSGSVDTQRLQAFFTEIEGMAQTFRITIIEFTWTANAHYKYRRGDWKKIKVKDRGGTNFEAALQYMEQNRIVGKVNIMLTDGECSIPTPRQYPMLWAICAHRGYEEISKHFTWGKTIEIPKYGL